MKSFLFGCAAITLIASPAFAQSSSPVVGADITITPSEQKGLREFLSHSRVHFDEEDGTSHGLVDAQQLLLFLNQKVQATTQQSKTPAPAATSATPARPSPVGAATIIPPSPSPLPSPTPSPSSK